MTLTRESIILIAICVIDLVVTLLLVNTKTAVEGNPLMAFYLKYGTGTFVMVKLALVLLPIFVFEWSRQYKPQFVKLMLRATIATYLGVYLMLFLTINVGASNQKTMINSQPLVIGKLDRPK
ncbi:MAG: DUF5658 family protein [Armatimonadota bacterium]|nr:DUF5658 family protein [bacterium]